VPSGLKRGGAGQQGKRNLQVRNQRGGKGSKIEARRLGKGEKKNRGEKGGDRASFFPKERKETSFNDCREVIGGKGKEACLSTAEEVKEKGRNCSLDYS